MRTHTGPGRLAPRLLLVALALAGGAAGAQGADLHFERLTVREGLPQNFVTAVARDSLGFVWVGTAGGLARYDGYGVDVFQPDPDVPGALRDNVVQSLLVARDGTLWVGTLRAGVARFDTGTETFRHYAMGPPGAPGGGSPSVADLFETADGAVWAATGDGLGRLDPETGRVTRLQDGPDFSAYRMAPAAGGGFWAAVRGRGLYRVDAGGRRLARHPTAATDQAVHALARGGGRLWVGTSSGLFAYDPASRTTTRVGAPEVGGTVSALFVEEARGWLWAATADGLALLDVDTERVLVVRGNAPGNLLGLPAPPATALFYDKTGLFWVATGGGGVAFADLQTSPLALYRHRPGDPASLPPSSVRAIETAGGVAWVGTNDRGLARLDRATGRVARLPAPPAPPGAPAEAGSAYWGLDLDRRGALWAVLPWGVVRHDARTGAVRRTYPFPDASYATASPAFVHHDRRGRYWVGSRRFATFDPETGAFRPVWPERGAVTAVHETQGGVFWVGTEFGLVRYDPATGARRAFRRVAGDPASLPSDEVLSMWAESDRVLWVGTAAGLARFDTRTGTARRFTTSTGALPDNYVSGVLGDGAGAVWASTNRGLARLDAATGGVTVVGERRGVQSPEFNRAASHRAADGTLFFGGIDGLNVFDPARLRENRHPPEVRLRRVTSGGAVLVASPGARGPADAVRLRPDQRDLSVEYVGLHYSDAGRNRYQYRLDGADADWQPLTTAREARYTNLDPGEYAFRVRAANAYGVWSADETLLTVRLPPPWWGSWWFRAFLVAAGLGAALGAYRWRTHEARLRERRLHVEVGARTRELAREQARTERQAEELRRLNEQQRRVFANVSHETRTPLTLILGPVEHALATDDLPAGLRRTLDGVRRNGRRLLHLVDRILDLSRLEAGHTELSPRPLDLGAFVRTLAAAFDEHAERRGLTLTHAVPDGPVVGRFDVSLLEHVLFNLLSNAVKYTPRGGKVRVSLGVEDDGAVAALRVRDTGAGIPADQVGRIFDRFALADPGGGTGIGLALVKEAVDLHGGTVEVASRPGFGTTFTVRLPLAGASAEAAGDGAPDAYAPDDYAVGDRLPALDLVDGVAVDGGGADPDAEPGGAGAGGAEDADRTTVLVVDDSDAVRSYVAGVLRPDYRVVEAADGEAALALAREHTPDLVVSDVVMPRMDGVELCAAVRADPDLRFVPVVLLTARVEAEDRLAGLGAGADDYLAKPFDVRELRARVANLIAGRRAWRDQFSPAPLADAFPDAPSADDALRQQIDDAVHERFTDGAFSADDLAAAVGLSGSQLRRRTNDLYGHPPTHVIRSYRLRQAALQLTKRTGTVAEIAYAVGFNSVSYFTRSFKDAFGRTPTAYADDAAEPAP